MRYIKPALNFTNSAVNFSIQNPTGSLAAVRMVSTNDAYVKVSAVNTAATTSDAFLKAGVEYLFSIDVKDFLIVNQAAVGAVSISFDSQGTM